MSFFGLNFLIWLYWLYPSYHACTLYTILPNYVTCPLLRVYNCVYNCVGAFPGCKAKYWLSLFPQFKLYTVSEVQTGNYSYCQSQWAIAHLLFTLHYGLLFTVVVPWGRGWGRRGAYGPPNRPEVSVWPDLGAGAGGHHAMLSLVSRPQFSQMCHVHSLLFRD